MTKQNILDALDNIKSMVMALDCEETDIPSAICN